MGTRAVIRFGDTRIAVHWDGYLDGLGKDLQAIGDKPTFEQIVEVAKKHCIDFATKDVQDVTAEERFEHISKKTNGKYTVERLRELYKQEKQILFGVMGAEDFPIAPFKQYNDYPDFEYDVKSDGTIMYRKLEEEYKDPKNKQVPWAQLETAETQQLHV